MQSRDQLLRGAPKSLDDLAREKGTNSLNLWVLTATEHHDCYDCIMLMTDAAVMARVTGSVGSTYSTETGPAGNAVKHSATVSRALSNVFTV